MSNGPDPMADTSSSIVSDANKSLACVRETRAAIPREAMAKFPPTNSAPFEPANASGSMSVESRRVTKCISDYVWQRTIG